MTRSEFMTALTETGLQFPWTVELHSRMLRARPVADQQGAFWPGYEFCPVTAVCRMRAGRFYGTDDAEVAAQYLQLDLRWARAVILAADLLPGYDPALRAELLAAVGAE